MEVWPNLFLQVGLEPMTPCHTSDMKDMEVEEVQLSVSDLLGGIQQLRGQEEGEGGSAKSPRLSTQGGGVP